MNIHEKRQQIIDFFKGVTVDGVTREVCFCSMSFPGELEVDLLAPTETRLLPIRLIFPKQED